MPSAVSADLEEAPPEIFPPDEESQLLAESTTAKQSANSKFSSGDYSSAVQGYEKALAVCPSYLDYDIAVLRSNIAACHLKLQEWKDAVESATQALDALDRVDPPPVNANKDKDGTRVGKGEESETGIQEISPALEVRLTALSRTNKTLTDIHKLRTKALLRRAKARREVGGWASLQGALDDYQAVSRPPHSLSSLDKRTVDGALRELPGRLETERNREMAEMMGKLKQLGNGILKPFGLSTENFRFEKDERSGGYSMNFDQGAK